MNIILQNENIESCENINTDDIVIYTSTFYNDSEESNVRSKLAIKFFKNAEKLGIKCIVTEGGSTNKTFLEELSKFKNITVIASNEGMGKDRRTALIKALEENPNSKYFLWSEPEKDDLITNANLTKLIKGADENNFDIVVPKRTKGSGRPKFQKWIENRANKKIHDELIKGGIDLSEILDLWFGPKLFTKKGAEYFSKYESELDKWDAIIKPVILALKDGIKVGSIEVNYKYDETQSENESSIENRDIMKKRVEQYRQIVKEILGKDTKTL